MGRDPREEELIHCPEREPAVPSQGWGGVAEGFWQAVT